MTSRRSFLVGLGASLVAAPSMVRAVVMPTRTGVEIVNSAVECSGQKAISLGYTITRKAMDRALYDSTFGNFPGCRIQEYSA